MKRLLALCATATLLTLSFPAASAAAPDEKWARGTISAMAADTLTVTVKGQAMTFIVDTNTDVMTPGASTKTREAKKLGAKPKLSDVLKVGDHVEVRYTETSGTMHATLIRGGISAPDATSAEAAKSLEGVVTAISGASVTVKPTEGEAVVFQVDPDSDVIGRGLGTMAREKEAKGAKILLTDAVKVGDTVLVRYKTMGEMKHASSIKVVKKTT